MAPMYQAAKINSKNLTLRAAAGMAEDDDKIRAMIKQLKKYNKRIEEIDRMISLLIRNGEQVSLELAGQRRKYKSLKSIMAQQIRKTR